MKCDTSYFEDGVKEGFFIPGMIKRSWATQIDILDNIRDICDRHEIKWFAACGTLLGTVRHGGFIPWDDDLDIYMLRDDYEKFLEVATKELPDKYVVNNVRTEEEYTNFLIRVVNNTVIDDSREYLMEHNGLPYAVGIDIFPLDNVYNDEREEKKRLSKIEFVRGFLNENNTLTKDEVGRLIKKECNLELDTNVPLINGLNKVIEQIFSECTDKDVDTIALMPYWVQNGDHLYKKSYFEKAIELPFENTLINVPVGYGEVLRIEYGNWETVYRGGGVHEYPFYSKQENEYRINRGRTLYTFDIKDRVELDVNRRNKHLQQSDVHEEIIALLDNAMIEVVGRIDSIDDSVFSILESCQQLAIELGTMLEKEYSTNNECVKNVEQYCELIYLLYESLQSGEIESDLFNRINTCIYNIKEIYRNKCKRKEVVFLPVKYKDWDNMRCLFEMYKKDSNCDVKVMPIPYASRENDGNVGKWEWDYALFADDLPLIDYRSIDFEKYHPDIYVIQNPWDEYGSAITVNPFFYSENIRYYTDKLIYVPFFRADEIDENDEKSKLNMRKYVLSPGVLNSDQTYVFSDKMKMDYLDCLRNELGDNDYEFMQDRIDVVDDLYSLKSECKTGKKRIAFYASISDIYVHGEKTFDKLQKCIDEFAKCKDAIEIYWGLDDKVEDYHDFLNDELSKQLGMLIERFKTDANGIIWSAQELTESVEKCDAYYGSGGILANYCQRRKIPVMIWNINV